MRHTFFRSVVLAAMLSGPLAAGAVLVQWTSLKTGMLFTELSPALWSARTYLRCFDLLTLIGVVPCVVWMSRFRRSRAGAADGRQAGLTQANIDKAICLRGEVSD
jgi:hypothetical protein